MNRPPGPIGLLHRVPPAEAAHGRAAGLVRIHPGAHVVVGLHLQMEPDLVVQLALEAIAPEQRAQPRSGDAPPAHEPSSGARSAIEPRKRSMVVDMRCQSSVVLGELSSPGRSDRVELRLPVLLRGAPFRRNPLLLLHAQERRIERALIELQQLAADLLDPPGEAVAVHRPEHVERAQDEEDQRALEDVGLVAIELLFHLETYRKILLFL